MTSSARIPRPRSPAAMGLLKMMTRKMLGQVLEGAAVRQKACAAAGPYAGVHVVLLEWDRFGISTGWLQHAAADGHAWQHGQDEPAPAGWKPSSHQPAPPTARRRISQGAPHGRRHQTTFNARLRARRSPRRLCWPR